MNEGNHRSYTERVSGCERDMLFLAGPVFMCFAVKFCFRLYGLQAFFSSQESFMVQYSICASFISHSGCVCWHCFNSVCVCACAFIYSGGVQRDRLSFKHMPGTSGRLQSSRGNKEEVRQKASPWLQATVEAATQEFKISFFSKSIFSSTPSLLPLSLL